MAKQPHIKPKDLNMINISTLVIAGNKDVIKNKHTNLIAESIPCSQLSIIKGTHFIAYKNSQEFNNIVYKFLCENR